MFNVRYAKKHDFLSQSSFFAMLFFPKNNHVMCRCLTIKEHVSVVRNMKIL